MELKTPNLNIPRYISAGQTHETEFLYDSQNTYAAVRRVLSVSVAGLAGRARILGCAECHDAHLFETTMEMSTVINCIVISYHLMREGFGYVRGL
jgi:hypothetical protein